MLIRPPFFFHTAVPLTALDCTHDCLFCWGIVLISRVMQEWTAKIEPQSFIRMLAKGKNYYHYFGGLIPQYFFFQFEHTSSKVSTFINWRIIKRNYRVINNMSKTNGSPVWILLIWVSPLASSQHIFFLFIFRQFECKIKPRKFPQLSCLSWFLIVWTPVLWRAGCSLNCSSILMTQQSACK